jgi:hypothetical protein
MFSTLLAASCCGQALGSWSMISDESSRGSLSLTMTITATAKARSDLEVWTFYVQRAGGVSETTSQTLRFDGQDYSCGDLGLEEHPDTVASRRLDSRTVEVSYKKSGTATRRVLRMISVDGKRMTLEIYFKPENGRPIEQRLVFERQTP